MTSTHGRTDAKTWPVSSLWFWKMMQANLEKETGNRKPTRRFQSLWPFKNLEWQNCDSKPCAVPSSMAALEGSADGLPWPWRFFSADLSICGFAGAGGTRIESHNYHRKVLKGRKPGMLASEFRGEVPKQPWRNLARDCQAKWLLWGLYLRQVCTGYTDWLLTLFSGLHPVRRLGRWITLTAMAATIGFDNLEWASHSENIRHSYATNPSRGNPGSKSAMPVMIRSLGSCNWTRFSSIKLAAEALSEPYQNSSEPMPQEFAGRWLWV